MDPMTNEEIAQKLASLEQAVATKVDAAALTSALNEAFDKSLADALAGNGEFLTAVMKPYAGELVRAGIAQTASAVVLAPVRWLTHVFGGKSAPTAAAAEAAEPAAPAAVPA